MHTANARRLWRHGTLPQLAAFDAIMRLGSFSSAAQALHMAQPTVSGHVRKLSDSVGVPLFEPQGRRMVPTEAARVLHRMAHEVFGALARAEEALGPLRADPGERVHLSVAVATHASFAAAVLARFASQWPQVDVSLHLHNHAELCRRHAAGLDDVLVMSRLPTGVTADEPGVVRLWPHEVALCVGASHALARADSLPAWPDLLDETFLMREPGSALRAQTEELFSRHGRRARQVIELSSNDALRQALAAGVGLALLPRHLSRAAGDSIVELPLPAPVPAGHWHALCPAEEPPCARAFVKLLQEAGGPAGPR